MNDTLAVANKIFEMLNEEKRIKCSFIRKDKDFCFIKVENYTNNNQNSIIVKNDIFFQIDDEEYFPLDEYEKATKKFINKLDNVVDVSISCLDENGNVVEYGFYISKADSKKIIEETILKLNGEYSFIKKVIKMKVSNFYGDFGFEAKWNGKTFIENTFSKR